MARKDHQLHVERCASATHGTAVLGVQGINSWKSPPPFQPSGPPRHSVGTEYSMPEPQTTRRFSTLSLTSFVVRGVRDLVLFLCCLEAPYPHLPA